MADIAGNRQTTGKRGGLRSTSFRKGMTGNPNGRPKLPQDFKQAVKECSLDCLARLKFWANSGNPAASVAASKLLLAYAHGNPPDFVTVTSPGQTINVRFANDDQPTAIAPETV